MDARPGHARRRRHGRVGGALGALFIAASCEVECRNDYIGYTLGGAAAGRWPAGRWAA